MITEFKNGKVMLLGSEDNFRDTLEFATAMLSSFATVIQFMDALAGGKGGPTPPVSPSDLRKLAEALSMYRNGLNDVQSIQIYEDRVVVIPDGKIDPAVITDDGEGNVEAEIIFGEGVKA